MKRSRRRRTPSCPRHASCGLTVHWHKKERPEAGPGAPRLAGISCVHANRRDDACGAQSRERESDRHSYDSRRCRGIAERATNESLPLLASLREATACSTATTNGFAQSKSSARIVSDGLVQLVLGELMEDDRQAHPSRSRAARKTSSAGRAAFEPISNSSFRRRASAIHRRRFSSGESVSRLWSSASASRARSSGGGFTASLSRSCKSMSGVYRWDAISINRCAVADPTPHPHALRHVQTRLRRLTSRP